MIQVTLDAVNQEILEERAEELGIEPEELLEYYEEIMDSNFEDDLEDAIQENDLGRDGKDGNV